MFLPIFSLFRLSQQRVQNAIYGVNSSPFGKPSIMTSQLQDNKCHERQPSKKKGKRDIDNHVYHFIHFTKCCQYDYNYTMPKKTRLQKLRNEERNLDRSQAVQTFVRDEAFFSANPQFKKDMVKSILFAILITAFEIGLYFIYYLRVWERR